MNIVDQYLDGLRAVLSEKQKKELSWASGATPQQIELLKQAYPQCPESLVLLLSHINGTHWQTCHTPNGDKDIAVLMLGSDVFEYPYFLRSVEQILEDRQDYTESIAEIYGDYLKQEPDLVDTRIDPHIPMNERLCFSHCMNNGGTSQLYIDFSPCAEGKVGQVVRFLHDPDEYVVLSDSFDDYLQKLMDKDYDFLWTMDEDDDDATNDD